MSCSRAAAACVLVAALLFASLMRSLTGWQLTGAHEKAARRCLANKRRQAPEHALPSADLTSCLASASRNDQAPCLFDAWPRAKHDVLQRTPAMLKKDSWLKCQSMARASCQKLTGQRAQGLSVSSFIAGCYLLSAPGRLLLLETWKCIASTCVLHFHFAQHSVCLFAYVAERLKFVYCRVELLLQIFESDIRDL